VVSFLVKYHFLVVSICATRVGSAGCSDQMRPLSGGGVIIISIPGVFSTCSLHRQLDVDCLITDVRLPHEKTRRHCSCSTKMPNPTLDVVLLGSLSEEVTG